MTEALGRPIVSIMQGAVGVAAVRGPSPRPSVAALG